MRNVRCLEDFKWENDSRRLQHEGVENWKIYSLHPSITSERFEFSIIFHDCVHYDMTVGVCDKNHPKEIEGDDVRIGQHGGIGWGWHSSNGRVYFPDSFWMGGRTIDKYFGKGDIIKLEVSKKKGRICFFKNNRLSGSIRTRDKLVKKGKQEIPEELVISVSVKNSIDLEIISFRDCSVPYKKGDLDSEINERMEFVIEEMSDLKCLMKNKTLNLCRTVFTNSKLKDIHTLSSLDVLESYSLEIDEDLIYRFLLGIDPPKERKRENLSISCLSDLFIFLNEVKLEKEKNFVELILKDTTLELQDLCSCFHDFCMKYENEDVRVRVSVFSEEPFNPNIELGLFRTSFGLILFDKMKKQKEYSDGFSDGLPELESVPTRLGEIIDSTRIHYLVNSPNRKKFQNLTLITSDGFEIQTFREILVLRTNFFYRMIHFGGHEKEEIMNHSRVHLIDGLTKEVVELLLQFIYMDYEFPKKTESSFEKTKKNFEVLIRLSVHAEKFSEFDLLHQCLKWLDSLLFSSGQNHYQINKEELEMLIFEYGYLLRSEILKTQICNVLSQKKIFSDRDFEEVEQKEKGDGLSRECVKLLMKMSLMKVESCRNLEIQLEDMKNRVKGLEILVNDLKEKKRETSQVGKEEKM